MKEELSQSLLSIDGQDVIVIGISYADAQSLSGCVRPKKGCQTLPRCKSYRLCKVDLASNPQDLTLTAIVEKKSQSRTLYFSRVCLHFLFIALYSTRLNRYLHIFEYSTVKVNIMSLEKWAVMQIFLLVASSMLIDWRNLSTRS